MAEPKPITRRPPTTFKVGDRYGRLVIVAEAGRQSNGSRAALCRCDCGAETTVRFSRLATGSTKSCGCLAAETHRTHGMSESSTFVSWMSMLNRCYNEKTPNYANYGARGIAVCQRWRESFENFLADMGERPEGKTLDRYPDKNGNYEPENCRWATYQEQNRNRRSNSLLTYNGVTKCIAEWAAEFNVNADAISWRLKRGWSAHEALTTQTVLGANQQRRGTAASRAAA